VGITTIDSARKLHQLTWVILLSQGYVAYEMNLSYLNGYNRLYEEGFAGMDNNSVAIALVTCLGLGLFVGLSAKTWWAKTLALGLTGAIGHAILLSYSRGGMLAMAITGAMAFLLIPKKLIHYVAILLAILIGLKLAGPEVRERFTTIMAPAEERDYSAKSRLDLWGNCLDCMARYPLTGVGPDHWGLIVHEYGWPPGKLAHSLWLQVGAELGIPGLVLLIVFYGSCVLRLWPLARHGIDKFDPALSNFARMAIASLIGFAVSAQFVSLDRLELPFYVALIGAGALKLATITGPTSRAVTEIQPLIG
jgi:O-antigen ligase